MSTLSLSYTIYVVYAVYVVCCTSCGVAVYISVAGMTFFFALASCALLSFEAYTKLLSKRRRATMHRARRDVRQTI